MLNFLKPWNKTVRNKILIVDDEPDIVRTLQDRLEMNGYVVITAGNGKEGLKKALEEKPDVILLDVIMPVMNGFEMLEGLRKHPEGKNLAVIMVTACRRADDIERAKACGVKDYVVKPSDLGVLLEKIENIIESERPVAG